MIETWNCGHATDRKAVDRHGYTWCYPCSDDNERAYAAHPSTTHLLAYVSGDGKSIATWPGGHLGYVLGAPAWRRYDQRTPFDAYIGGRRWHGRGVPGMYVTLRPYKRQP